MAIVPIVIPQGNPEERKLIGKLRRVAKKHHLRLVKDRTVPPLGPGVEYSRQWNSYKLQSAAVIGEHLTLEEALRICNQLDGAR